jgi:hypothetical protein
LVATEVVVSGWTVVVSTSILSASEFVDINWLMTAERTSSFVTYHTLTIRAISLGWMVAGEIPK